MVFTIEQSIAKANDLNNESTFEEALKMSKFGKFHYFLILISGIFMASTFFETMGINYVLPVAECDLNIVSKSQYGLISGVWFAGIIASSHTWGIMSDHYGRRKILIVASITAFLASLFSSLSVSLLQMAFFRFLNGLCISGTISTIFAYLGEFLSSKTRSRAIMFSSVLFASFCMLLPVLAWITINQKWQIDIPIIDVTYKPWRLFLVVCGFPSFVCGIILLKFPESPKFTFSQGDEEKTIKIFARIYHVNTGKMDYDVYKIKPNEEFGESKRRKHVVKMMLSQTIYLFRNYTRSIGTICALQFGIYFVCNGYLLFFPDILNQTAEYLKGTDNSGIGICEIVEMAIERRTENANETFHETRKCVDELDISAYYYAIILEGCYTVGFMIVTCLVHYIGPLSIFTFVFFTTGICGLIMTFIQNPAISTYLYIWLLVSGTNNNLLSTVAYDLFPTNLRSLALSISLIAARFGALIGGNFAGYMMDGYCNVSFVMSGIILLICCVVSFFIPGILKRK